MENQFTFYIFLMYALRLLSSKVLSPPLPSNLIQLYTFAKTWKWKSMQHEYIHYTPGCTMCMVYTRLFFTHLLIWSSPFKYILLIWKIMSKNIAFVVPCSEYSRVYDKSCTCNTPVRRLCHSSLTRHDRMALHQYRNPQPKDQQS